VRGRDHAHVDAHRLRGADGEHLALLQRAQQLRLQIGRQVADLVEEQRAAIRGAEQAGLGLVGAGEGALDVAEQLALHELPAQRRAVERHQLARAAAQAVELVRDPLLARAGLADDQRRRGVGRRARDLHAQRAHGGRVAGQRIARHCFARARIGRLLLVDQQRVAEAHDRPVHEQPRVVAGAHAVHPGAVAAAEIADRVGAGRGVEG